MYFLCVAYISANNRDINTKLSGYLPWYLGKFWVGGNNHYRSILLVNPISQKIIEILTNKFEDIILGVYPPHQQCHGYLGNFFLGGQITICLFSLITLYLRK